VRLSPELEAKCLAIAGDTGEAVGPVQPIVVVPMPPSTNNLFAGRDGRYPSKAYKAWRKVAYPILAQLGPPQKLPCEVVLTVRGKVNRQRDLDNCAKAPLDGLVAVGVLPGDNVRHVVGVALLYRPDAGSPRMEIRFA